jgi:hypothetical protein
MNIEKNIPIPDDTRVGYGSVKRTLEQMEVGDSVVVPKEKVNYWRSVASVRGIKVVVRRISESECRVWKKQSIN